MSSTRLQRSGLASPPASARWGSGPSGAERRRAVPPRRLRSPGRGALLAALAYAAYAVFLTWPLATDPGHLVSGPADFSDRVGSIAGWSYLLSHHISPLAPATLHALNAPEGITQSWVINWVSLPSTLVIYGLSAALGATAGANTFLGLGFVLSGLSMFLLCRRLFGHSGVAFLAGFAFAFFPFAVAQTDSHPLYMDGFVFVAVMWRMLELADLPTRRNGLLAGTATALAMWWTPYFILFAAALFAVMALPALAVGRARARVRPVIAALAVAVLPILGLIVGLGLLAALSGGGGAGQVRTQGIHELYVYAGRAAQWVLPDRHNILFGALTRGYLGRHLHGSNFGENSLYLGLSVLGLAAVGAAAAVGEIRRRGRPAVDDPRVVAALAGLLLAVTTAVLAAPPTVKILGVPLVMPSGIIYVFTSTWRVYARVVEVTEMGLCITLAFGLSRLLAGRGRRAELGILALVGLVLVCDLWARPPIRASSLQPPREYVWLAHHPGGIVADYPLFPGDFPDYQAELRQTQDGHPLLNGYVAGSDAETLKLGLADLREPGTAGRLAALGVRYIVVHPGEEGSSAANLRRRGFALRDAARDGSVWQVTAPVPSWRLDETAGFGPVLGPVGARYRWVDGPARLAVVAPGCRRCRFLVRFRSHSSEMPRTLTVSDASTGHVLARTHVPVGRAVEVDVPVAVRDGIAHLDLQTDIPAQWPRIPGWSPESVLVQEPTIEPVGRPRHARGR